MSAPGISPATGTSRWLGLDGIAYGGDYNPEQWPADVWPEDVRLMRDAGVNLVTVGVFSWAMLEPEEGRYDFGWLDRVLDLLHANGIRVDLGTPSAAPPAWFTRRYPDSRPVTREGHVLGTGARQTYCPSSPDYAAATTRMAAELARRYRDHPALVLWHVHNEYGAPTGECYCPTSVAHFQRWLADRYGHVDALNAAWGTAFWGQRYGEFAEIDAPRIAPSVVNPAQRLDFMRFCDDALLDCYRRERDVLRELSPGVPVTTNFMATNCKNVNYWRWAGEVDVVANDHYLRAEQPDNHIDLAMAADLTRSLAGGAPWVLMEHSTGAVNWQPRNIAKRPGEMLRNSMAHLARGADGILFFQWRAARSGAEKFHSAMLPHGGTSSRTWRDVVNLGERLGGLAELRGSRVAADVAVVWDWESWWALELDWRPSVDLDYYERVSSYYTALWRAHHTVDFVRPDADLSAYPLVVVPSLYLTTPAAAAALSAYVSGGGTLVVSYFSGIVDATDSVHPGRYPGALRELLGLTVEEWLPLRSGESVRVSDGLTGDVWAEDVWPAGAETILSYVDGPAAGGPAVLRNSFGQGAAWYVSTRLAEVDQVLRRAAVDAGLAAVDLPDGVEQVLRVAEDRRYAVLINHDETAHQLPLSGHELITGTDCANSLILPPGEVRVLRLS